MNLFLWSVTQGAEISYYAQLSGIDVISKPFDALSLADRLREIWNKNQDKIKVKG